MYEVKITKQEQDRLKELLAKQKAQDEQDRQFFAYCLKRRPEVEAYFKKHDEQKARRSKSQQQARQVGMPADADFLLGDEVEDEVDYEKIQSPAT